MSCWRGSGHGCASRGDGSETSLEAAGIRLDLLTREGEPRRPGRPPARARGRAARPPDAPRRTGLHPRGDPLRGLGLRPRSRHQRGPGLRRLPAAQARPAGIAGTDRDRALGGIPAERAGDEDALGEARPARQAGALDRGDRRRRLRGRVRRSAGGDGPRVERDQARGVAGAERTRRTRRAGRGLGRSRRSRTPSPTSKRPSCSPVVRPWSPPCWPAICSRPARPPRCGGSPPPPPRSMPAT